MNLTDFLKQSRKTTSGDDSNFEVVFSLIVEDVECTLFASGTIERSEKSPGLDPQKWDDSWESFSLESFDCFEDGWDCTGIIEMPEDDCDIIEAYINKNIDL